MDVEENMIDTGEYTVETVVTEPEVNTVTNNIKETPSKEIDVWGIVKKVFSDKTTLFKFAGVFLLIGIVVAIDSPKQYTSTAQLAPESYELMGSSSLGGMASALGISLGASASSDAIYPEIYPDLFASTDFQISLFQVPVRLKDSSDSRSYYDHLLKDKHVSFWEVPSVEANKLINKFFVHDEQAAMDNSVDPFRLTKTQNNICALMRSSISCVVDKKTNIITISVTDEDPLVAATMNDTLMNRLQDYITEYRTKKARHDVEYYQKLCTEAYNDYEEACDKYGQFADSHMQSVLQMVSNKQEQMENDMAQKYNTYTTFYTQLQAAKAKVQECTPVFTVIQSPSVPVKASSIPRSLIVVLFVLFGGVLGALWTLYGKEYLGKKMKRSSRSKKSKKN